MIANDGKVVVRVGIPHTGGQLVKAARESGFATLFSANAFAKTFPKGHEREGFFRSFAFPDPDQFDGLDAALDSAGFVAAVRYRDYRWSVSDYMDLAASRPWTFYAAMDYCCEREVSGDRLMRLLRLAATAQLLGQCNRAAVERDIKPPMPVIQGFTPDEYALCAHWLPVHPWPDLVGIGSVCRRHIGGQDGLGKVLGKLDEILPTHVKFHLFGVKSSALLQVGKSHRIYSMDSMAWDARARIEKRTGRTAEFRIGCMKEWQGKQSQIANQIGNHRSNVIPMQNSLFDFNAHRVETDAEFRALEALALTFVEMLLANELDYRGALVHAGIDAQSVLSILRNCGGRLSDAVIADIEDVVPGFGRAVESLNPAQYHLKAA